MGCKLFSYENDLYGVVTQIMMEKQVTEENLRNIKNKIEQMKRNTSVINLEEKQNQEIERVKNNAVEFGEARLRREKPELIAEYEALSKEGRLTYLITAFPEKQSSYYDKMIGHIKVDIHPLLSRTLSSRFAKELQAIKDPTVFAQIDNVCLTARMVLNASFNPESTKKEKTNLMLNHYKTEVEGIFSFQINMIMLALILDGRQYYRGKKRLKIETMKQIRKETLANKLQFLSTCGFGYFADACNRAVRNCFSHEHYEIADDGSFTYWLGGRKVIINQKELIKMIETINSACSVINRAILEITTQWIEEKVDAELKNIQINKLNPHSL